MNEDGHVFVEFCCSKCFFNVEINTNCLCSFVCLNSACIEFHSRPPRGDGRFTDGKVTVPKTSPTIGSHPKCSNRKKLAAWICGYKLDILNLPKLEGNETLEMYGKFGGEWNTRNVWIIKLRCWKGGGDWGTLRIPREDWGTLENISED